VTIAWKSLEIWRSNMMDLLTATKDQLLDRVLEIKREVAEECERHNKVIDAYKREVEVIEKLILDKAVL